MNNNLSVNPKQKIKTVISILVAIMLTLCIGFAALGCGYKFETEYEYISRVTKEEYKIEKILWLEPAVNGNTISGIDYYSPSGYLHRKESFFPNGRAGWYVVGIDNRGYETFILVPQKKDSKIKPRVYQWPFAYSFTEIANFAAEYGYKYADGIDDSVKEYLLHDNDALHALDKKYGQNSKSIDVFTELFEDPDKKYDELDVKFVFNFMTKVDDEWRIYYITQEDGKLIMYEEIETDTETNINVIASYERNKQDTGTAGNSELRIKNAEL